MTPYSLHDMTVNKIECMNNEICLWIKDDKKEGVLMYEEILKSCKEWFYNIQVQYSDKLKFHIDLDDSKGFVANIDSDKYLSQLVVEDSDFQPYNYVEFTILDVHQDINQVPTFWYGDKEGDTVQEIINNLNLGLKVLIEKMRWRKDV